MKNIVVKITPLLDLLLYPFVLLSTLMLRFIRAIGIKYFPVCKKAFFQTGVYPIRDHYYEPLFNPKHLQKPLTEDRNLPGINLNLDNQIELLSSFDFQKEYEQIPDWFIHDEKFHFKNGSFETGDAEFWYSIIRTKKPKIIIEIGSGNSTKMGRLAIAKNKEEDPGYECKHYCIEPYEMPWLENIGIEIMRKRVEDFELSFFSQLGENDILFIDSSHVIRPQGDVLYEYLQLLPTLKKGVIVHIHDIFTPRDYLPEWFLEDIRFWNEQYLLEAFLSSNSNWKIIGAVNYLANNNYELIKSKFPRFTKGKQPGSFYIQKVMD